jgi:hypothetical protein
VPPERLFGASIVLSFLTWGIIAARYVWPALRSQPRATALQPLLLLHSFRLARGAVEMCADTPLATCAEGRWLSSAFAVPPKNALQRRKRAQAMELRAELGVGRLKRLW